MDTTFRELDSRGHVERDVDGDLRIGWPSHLTMEVHNYHGVPYVLVLTIRADGPKPVCTSLLVQQEDDGPPVLWSKVRSIPIPSLAAACLERATKRWRVVEHEHVTVRATVDRGDLETGRKARRATAGKRPYRTMTPELLREVAEVHLSAHGYRERQAVARHFGIPTDTASKWIRQARDLYGYDFEHLHAE